MMLALERASMPRGGIPVVLLVLFATVACSDESGPGGAMDDRDAAERLHTTFEVSGHTVPVTAYRNDVQIDVEFDLPADVDAAGPARLFDADGEEAPRLAAHEPGYGVSTHRFAAFGIDGREGPFDLRVGPFVRAGPGNPEVLQIYIASALERHGLTFEDEGEFTFASDDVLDGDPDRLISGRISQPGAAAGARVEITVSGVWPHANAPGGIAVRDVTGQWVQVVGVSHTSAPPDGDGRTAIGFTEMPRPPIDGHRFSRITLELDNSREVILDSVVTVPLGSE